MSKTPSIPKTGADVGAQSEPTSLVSLEGESRGEGPKVGQPEPIIEAVRRPAQTRAIGKVSGTVAGEAVTSLSRLEAEIMNLLWDLDRPVHIMEVAEAALYRRRGQGLEPIAFATITTTLRRLTEKGILMISRLTDVPASFDRREARTPSYAPTVGREEMAARILDNVSRKLLGTSMHTLILGMGGVLDVTHGHSPTEGSFDQAELQRLMEALEAEVEQSVEEAND